MRIPPLLLRPAVVASLAIHGGVAAVAVGSGAPGRAPRSVEGPPAVISFESADAEDALPSSPDPSLEGDVAPPPLELPEVRAMLAEFEFADMPFEGTLPPSDDGVAAPAARALVEGVTSRTISVRLRPASNDSSAHVAPAPRSARPPSDRGRVVAPPRTLSTNRAPDYPAEARARGFEGVTTLRVTIRADGSVASVELKASSGHPALDRAATEAALSWAFIPARIDDAAVSMTVEVPVAFRLY